MAKKITDEPKHHDADRTVTTIKPEAFEKLVARVTSVNGSMDTDRKKKSELIVTAVEDGLHKVAFAWFMKLRKMDPLKRNELLFHFEVYCERGNFTREELFTRTADEPAGEPPADGDEEEDLRPRHLKQPDASAASESAVDKIKQDALSKVGRGPQHKPH